MPSFAHRSQKKELLDGDNIPFHHIKKNMQELGVINVKLGGHAISIAGLKKVIAQTNFTLPIQIVEIGCGGGDNLQAIKTWADKNKIAVVLTGIDLNPECILYAQGLKENSDIKFICSDYRQVQFDNVPDVIFSSLFCHHFSNNELATMLQWMKVNTSTGFFINDLHRHRFAYYSIKLLTTLFSNSYLVKNDAPLSVLRGFTKQEWKNIFYNAGITNYQCLWKWAFRWLMIYKHKHATTV